MSASAVVLAIALARYPIASRRFGDVQLTICLNEQLVCQIARSGRQFRYADAYGGSQFPFTEHNFKRFRSSTQALADVSRTLCIGFRQEDAELLTPVAAKQVLWAQASLQRIR